MNGSLFFAFSIASAAFSLAVLIPFASVGSVSMVESSSKTMCVLVQIYLPETQSGYIKSHSLPDKEYEESDR
jgi:hypothetical protein